MTVLTEFTAKYSNEISRGHFLSAVFTEISLFQSIESIAAAVYCPKWFSVDLLFNRGARQYCVVKETEFRWQIRKKQHVIQKTICPNETLTDDNAELQVILLSQLLTVPAKCLFTLAH